MSEAKVTVDVLNLPEVEARHAAMLSEIAVLKACIESGQAAHNQDRVALDWLARENDRLRDALRICGEAGCPTAAINARIDTVERGISENAPHTSEGVKQSWTRRQHESFWKWRYALERVLLLKATPVANGEEAKARWDRLVYAQDVLRKAQEELDASVIDEFDSERAAEVR